MFERSILGRRDLRTAFGGLFLMWLMFGAAGVVVVLASWLDKGITQ